MKEAISFFLSFPRRNRSFFILLILRCFKENKKPKRTKHQIERICKRCIEVLKEKTHWKHFYSACTNHPSLWIVNDLVRAIFFFSFSFLFLPLFCAFISVCRLLLPNYLFDNKCSAVVKIISFYCVVVFPYSVFCVCVKMLWISEWTIHRHFQCLSRVSGDNFSKYISKQLERYFRFILKIHS